MMPTIFGGILTQFKTHGRLSTGFIDRSSSCWALVKAKAFDGMGTLRRQQTSGILTLHTELLICEEILKTPPNLGASFCEHADVHMAFRRGALSWMRQALTTMNSARKECSKSSNTAKIYRSDGM